MPSKHMFIPRLLVVLVLITVNSNLFAKVDFSDNYERIFQIRVVSADAGSKSSIGSGFQVSADGLIMTNYHVVSSFVNSPDEYEIKYVANDGQKGVLQLLDFDVISDLAILRHPKPNSHYFNINTNTLAKGVTAYALGNPSDWGVIMVQGATNGFVEHSYEDRILFSGSLNPGMSGGPSLNKDAEIIGVNVATAGSQLSFFVPAIKAQNLLDNVRDLAVSDYQAETAQQIKDWQGPRVQSLLDREWKVEEFTNRNLFGEIRHDFQCWGDTNESHKERVVASVYKACSANDDIYLSYNLTAGQMSFSFSETTPIKLNSSQFANSRNTSMSADNESDYEHSTNYSCESDFVSTLKPHIDSKDNNYHRVVTCIRAYKNLAGLYDSLLLVRHHKTKQSFTAHLSLSALDRAQIKALNKRFVEEVL